MNRARYDKRGEDLDENDSLHETRYVSDAFECYLSISITCVFRSRYDIGTRHQNYANVILMKIWHRSALITSRALRRHSFSRGDAVAVAG